jgi:glycosyltransferase involved in cell wall biosynthesis
MAQRAIRGVLGRFQPDVVSVWNLEGLPLSTCFVTQRQEIPVCYYLFDEWLTRWRKDPWHTLWRREASSASRRLAKRCLSGLLQFLGVATPTGRLDLAHVQCASGFLKRSALAAGEPIGGAEVVPWGVDLERFREPGCAQDSARLLFVGQVMPHKGVHTAIEAMGVLAHGNPPVPDVRLTIVGPCLSGEYRARLDQMIAAMDLYGRVGIVGPVAPEHIPSVYRDHGTFLFPSTWEEPFGIGQIEAMAASLAVVTTATGGAGEIVTDGHDGMVFPPGDAEACADRIRRLIADRGLYERIRHAGRRKVEQRFRFETTLDRIEACLLNACP